MDEDIRYNVGLVGFWLFWISICILVCIAFFDMVVAVVLTMLIYLPLLLTVINIGNSILGTRRFEPFLMFGIIYGALLYAFLSGILSMKWLYNNIPYFDRYGKYAFWAFSAGFFIFCISLVIVGFYPKKVSPRIFGAARTAIIIGNIVNLLCALAWIMDDLMSIIFAWTYNLNILLLSVRYIKSAGKGGCRYKGGKKMYVFEDITKLETPIGYFSVLRGKENISFSVRKNRYDRPWGVCDKDNNYLGDIVVENNYEIVIDIGKLTAGLEYEIKFSDGVWRYNDSDEGTVCFSWVNNNYAVGIGCYDPNDDRPKRYILEVNKNKNGFIFKPVYNSTGEIVFKAAWVKIDGFDESDHETAIGFLLT